MTVYGAFKLGDPWASARSGDTSTFVEDLRRYQSTAATQLPHLDDNAT